MKQQVELLPVQKKIMDLLLGDFTLDAISAKINKRQASITRIVNKMLDKKYIFKNENENKYYANEQFSFEKPKEKRDKSTFCIDHDQEAFFPIAVYYPTETEKEAVFKLHHEGLRRIEIAKRLKLTKAQVLWILGDGGNKKTIDLETDHVFCDELQLAVFNSLIKTNMTIDSLSRKLKITHDEVYKVIGELDELGAIQILFHRNHTAYLQNDVIMKPTKRRESHESKNEHSKVK